MCICELIVAVVVLAVPVANRSGGKANIAFVCIYIAGFASTWGLPLGSCAVRSSSCHPCQGPLALHCLQLALELWYRYATPYLVQKGPGHAVLAPRSSSSGPPPVPRAPSLPTSSLRDPSPLSRGGRRDVLADHRCRTPRANAEIRARRSDLEGAVAPPRTTRSPLTTRRSTKSIALAIDSSFFCHLHFILALHHIICHGFTNCNSHVPFHARASSTRQPPKIVLLQHSNLIPHLPGFFPLHCLQCSCIE